MGGEKFFIVAAFEELGTAGFSGEARAKERSKSFQTIEEARKEASRFLKTNKFYEEVFVMEAKEKIVLPPQEIQIAELK